MIKKFYRRLSCASVVFLMVSLMAHAQSQLVSGKVTDATGNPVPGASVLLKGTTTGTSTDTEGVFKLQAASSDILIISFIGYATQEIQVGDKTQFTVTLLDDVASLQEVVVIGYGEQKKALNTGANFQVKGEDIQKMSTTNALQALQGQTPGVQITSTSGQPGEALKVVVRGLGTIGNSGPLYVVDGVITNDITFLNPADIQSIDVLKDAASAAIYGSQAANGVILITTKKGKAGGRSQITFDSYYGVQNVARKLPMLNAYEYAVIMNEAAVNSGLPPYFTDTQMANIKSGATNWQSDPSKVGLSNDQIVAMKGGTNWMDKMFSKNAPTQNYVLGVSGGSETSTYSTSLAYTTQAGIVGGSAYSNYDRYNFRFNSEHKLYKDAVKFGQNLNFSYTDNHGIGVGGQYNNSLRPAMQASPFLPMYNADGTFWDNSQSKWFTGEANPYAQMVYGNQNRNDGQKLLGNAYFEIKPIKNLKFRSSIGIDYSANSGHSYTPVYHLSVYSFNDTTKVSQYMSKGRTIMWDNTLSYTLKVGESQIEVLAGSSAFQNRGSSISGSNYNLALDGLDYAWLSNSLNTTKAARMSLNGSPYDHDNRMSYFGRLNYSLKETYLVNATFRADGSSRFAKGHRWGYFPSVSAGWILSNEDFFSPLAGTVDYLKVRASWGRVGNLNVPFFQYMSPVSFSNVGYPFGTTEGSVVAGAYQPQLGNPNLKWETSEQSNVGLEARFLNGKVSTTLDWYNKTTKDWLVRPPILATAGSGAPWINGGNVTNKGIEMMLSYTNSIGGLKYTLSANGAINKNNVKNIPTADGIIHGDQGVLFDNSGEFNRVQAGNPVGFFWGYKTNGLFQSESDVSNYRSASGELLQATAKPGDVKLVDTDHNGVINANDKVNLGSPIPKATYGFNIQLSYKAFDFNVQAAGVYGNKIVQSYRNIARPFPNYTTQILHRWHGEGTSNSMPRVDNTNSNWANFSDLYIQDGSYLRISNVTLGYNLSQVMKAKVFSQARIYVSALNLITFTKYNGMDPEVGFGNTSWASGVDIGYYPRPRTYMVGLNIKF